MNPKSRFQKIFYQTRILILIMTVLEINGTVQTPDLIPYRKGNKWGFSDKNKKIIIECKYDYAFPFKENLALVKLNGKYGFIDKTGKEVTSIKYDYAYSFSDGLTYVKLNDK